ncbi:5'-3' exonuclease [Mycoplasmopsis mucosicanis]|uniref:5'-3' exonuclease n=1 Tax=Mycoplasmopsis mucosicanis TaxID=458208 RepID=A0A507SXP2_9BACT|nr:5'-3' exonuclease [Mycoplasmopsis mucosicanis]TQC54003.1 5'-3' exonuclease [Mycoplasmopsis mucosicanis]
MRKNTFLLIDGNFLMFQSFYASYAMSNGNMMNDYNGRSTNGVHVFLMTLSKIIDYVEPTHLFIAFDAFGKTKRHEKYDDYKAGRTKAPAEIFEQFKYIKEILSAFNIQWLEQVGDEADDLIATLAQNKDALNIIYSKDQDLLQLVNENTYVLFKDKYGEFDCYTDNNFESYFNLQPYQIPDFKGLAGDSSDNIKGVVGIGKIGAIKLINQYENIENIYKNIDEIKGATKQKLINGKDDAFFCKGLTILNTQVNMNTNLDDYLMSKINKKQGNAKLDEFGLQTAKRKLEII